MTATCPLCVICTTEREATHGYLCTGHFERLAAMLRDVELEACLLDARPSMAIRTGSGGGSLASERSPVRLDVLAFRDPQTRQWTRDAVSKHPLPAPKAFGPWCLFCAHETCTDWRAGRQRDMHDDEHDAGSERLMSILGILNGWARVVREERDLTEPERITIAGERDTLTRQLNWLAEQPFIDETYAEIRQLVGSLRSLNGTADEKPVGRCYLPAEDGNCNGPIWVDAVAGRAHCGRCQQAWDGPQLAMLNFELERARAEADRPRTEDGRKMLTAQEMARRLGCSVNAVRITVTRRRIHNVRGHYDPEDFAEQGKVSA